MSVNVVCVGRETITYPYPQVRKTEYGRPCGWKGERFPSVERDWARIIGADEAFAERATAKPCPRCGGRVELIPTAP